MTDSQVVVTKDVNQDGEETLVSNVRIFFHSVWFKVTKYWYFVIPFYILWTGKNLRKITTVWCLHKNLMKTYSKYSVRRCFLTKTSSFFLKLKSY